eukprot:5974728-Amphidinium_carterae.1
MRGTLALCCGQTSSKEVFFAPDIDEYTENVLCIDPEGCARGAGSSASRCGGAFVYLRDVLSEAWLSQRVLHVNATAEPEGHLSVTSQYLKWDYSRGDLQELLRRELVVGQRAWCG